jgi:hypothetical protein
MPYSETHEIQIGPITLPEGVRVDVTVAFGTGGQQAVTISGSTDSSKKDTVALLQSAFALLMTAATAEGVGAPVFSAPPGVTP